MRAWVLGCLTVAAAQRELCDNACQFVDAAGDGICDDGGPGSDNARCQYGSDCTDCGAREFGSWNPCQDKCGYNLDGECDDG